jgi:hypothetical protein
MNKSCFVLIVAIVAINPASLFAGETMITRTSQTTRSTTKCDFRVDKCETSVAEDPSYIHFKDYPTIPGAADVSPATGDPALYHVSSVIFKDYPPPPTTVEELLALIQEKLNKVNCPLVEFAYDDTTGDITIHYVHSDCDCDCDWTVNIRDVKADDFVWKRTKDNYSERLGQMERRKFHTANARDAQDIQSAFTQICVINAWTMSKY